MAWIMLARVGIWRGLRESSVSMTISSGLYRYRSVMKCQLNGYLIYGEVVGPTDQEFLDVMGIVDTSPECRGGVEVVDTDQQGLAASGTCGLNQRMITLGRVCGQGMLTLRVLEEWSLGSMSTLHLRTIRLLSSWWPY